MKRLVSVLLWVFAFVSLTTPAHAALVIDPLIGVRGSDGNSQALTDSTLQAFVPCSRLNTSGAGFPEDYGCAPYVTGGINIFSLDLQFFDQWKNPFPVEALTVDTVYNHLWIMQVLDDITVRLSQASPSPLQCVSMPCQGLLIYTAAVGPLDVPASYVSVVAFNQGAVPEPGVVMLLGGALTGLLARRSRRR